MKRVFLGLIFGVLAGIIDVTPMIIQKLPLSANLSAFSMWIVVGFLIATSDLKLPPILKGILIAFLVLSPIAIIIAWQESASLIPIFITTFILGAGLGYFLG